MSCLTDIACKAIIKRIAKKYGVSALAIVTELMSADDKNDMRNGDLPIQALECHVKVWKTNGTPCLTRVSDVPIVNPKGTS